MFLPCTQNINASGTVTTLFQDQRPQELNTIIPGRIIKWWVKEGDMVKKGDTIVQLADVKDDYLDPNLVERTEEQLKSKQLKIDFYQQKIQATLSQVIALEQSRDFKIAAMENKLEQLKRKVLSDSAELVAADIDLGIATLQFSRAKQMFSDGIIALTELERRTAQFNKMQALATEKQQKLMNTRQDLSITRIEMLGVRQDADDKIFKARSEIAGAQSEVASTGGDLAKNTNQLANYVIRGSQRWLIAPQDGQPLIDAGLEHLGLVLAAEGAHALHLVGRHAGIAVVCQRPGRIKYLPVWASPDAITPDLNTSARATTYYVLVILAVAIISVFEQSHRIY
jgi:multidrug efflux pump subunit AcrA (membrane-fusion protein)